MLQKLNFLKTLVNPHIWENCESYLNLEQKVRVSI